jgi:hypothetical protein
MAEDDQGRPVPKPDSKPLPEPKRPDPGEPETRGTKPDFVKNRQKRD